MDYCNTDPSCVQVEVSIIVTRKNEIKAVYVLYSKYKNTTILLEVKHHKENLENHFSQLSGYFYNFLSKYEIKFGILLNGIEYRFYAIWIKIIH